MVLFYGRLCCVWTWCRYIEFLLLCAAGAAALFSVLVVRTMMYAVPLEQANNTPKSKSIFRGVQDSFRIPELYDMRKKV